MNDQERLLNIFLRLQAGERLSKSQLAHEFSLSEKSIQRDFSTLGRFLEGQNRPVVGAELADVDDSDQTQDRLFFTDFQNVGGAPQGYYASLAFYKYQ
jgi:hypothetical protein